MTCWRRNVQLTASGDLKIEEPQQVRRPARHQVSRPSRRRFWVRRLGVLMVVLLLWLTWSIGSALTAPGADTTAARLAEWARFHGLGWAISGLEQAQYAMNPPKIGGSLVGGIPRIAANRPAPSRPTRPATVSYTHLRAHETVLDLV